MVNASQAEPWRAAKVRHGMADAEPTIAPMEARLVDALPSGAEWIYEPKWDGFRCIARRDGREVTLTSKSGKPLARYFPEVVEMLEALAERHFVLDGELTIATGDTLSFAALQARLHPAESRIRKLAAETPAQFILFDCLALGGRDLTSLPFAERRATLAAFFGKTAHDRLLLSPVTTDVIQADRWLARAGTALDGVVAKRLDLPYQPGVRAMAKLKQHRSADCVVGGFRYAGTAKSAVGSLLLGLFDDAGLLNHVGFTSSFDAAEKKRLLNVLKPLIGPPGFTGDAPGGPSRWSTERSVEWQPLRHELVVEVRYDQVTGCRFRHGTTFLRWRPDKAPGQCGMDQLARELKPAELEELIRA
ncbi:ATP-dependent DNA ligase [Sphingomonas sp.]|uniref:ATP-dependent DNA ligase n=1 Tax=Sphingomonas sp. TaxID=28214 RepID=UPI003B3AE942